jgi:hypothetical protein
MKTKTKNEEFQDAFYARSKGYVVHVDGMDGDVLHGPVSVCNAVYHALTNGADNVQVKVFGGKK